MKILERLPPLASFWSAFKEKLLSGVVWNVLATVSAQGAIFLTNVVLANLLGIADFGSFALLLSTMMAITAVAQAGVGIVATKYVAELRMAAPQRAGRVLALCRIASAGLGVTGTMALAIGAPVLAGVLMDRPSLTAPMAIVSPYVLFSVVNAYQVGALYGFGAFRQMAIAGAVHGIAHLLLCTAGAVLAGLEGAVAAFALSAALRWALFAMLLKRVVADAGIVITRSGAMSETRLLRDFALPSALSGITHLPAVWLANLLLSRQPEGTELVGAYHAANQLRLLVLQLPLVLNGVALSVLNQQRGRADRRSYQAVFWANLWITCLVAVPIAFAMGLFSREVLGVFGREFRDAEVLLMVLLASTLPEIVAIATYQHMQAEGRMWLSLLAVALPRDLAFVVISYALVGTWSAVGVGTAYFCAWTIACASIIAIAAKIGFKDTHPR
jgi:O-antigen/teichoic acid export membrane protein